MPPRSSSANRPPFMPTLATARTVTRNICIPPARLSEMDHEKTRGDRTRATGRKGRGDRGRLFPLAGGTLDRQWRGDSGAAAGACPTNRGGKSSRLCSLPLERRPAFRALRQGLRRLPRHGQVDDPGVSTSLTNVPRLCPLPSSSAQSLHDAFQNDLREGRGETSRGSQRMLRMSPDDFMARHPRERVVQASLRLGRHHSK